MFPPYQFSVKSVDGKTSLWSIVAVVGGAPPLTGAFRNCDFWILRVNLTPHFSISIVLRQWFPGNSLWNDVIAPIFAGNLVPRPRGTAGTHANAISRWLLGIMGSLTTVTRVIVNGTTPPTYLPSFDMTRARLLGTGL